jgi:creatinine amidohydrolase
MLLALDPGCVDIEQAEVGDTRPLDELLPTLRAGGLRSVTANGVLGDPTGATADEGHRLLAALCDDLDGVVATALHEVATGRSGPGR